MALKRTIINGVINRIRLVGVELEGGWTEHQFEEEIERDGSVQFVQQVPELPPNFTDITGFDTNGNPVFRQRPGGQAPVPRIHPGEVVLRDPMPPNSEALREWVRSRYPQHVNATCGLHVHMSFFNRLNYQRLMTPDYTAAMVNGLKEWFEAEKLPKDHPLWERLTNPDHRHCAHIYLGDNQVKMARKDYNSRGTAHSRYTAINYCDRQHGTVECRLLSMFEQSDQALRGIDQVIFITNKFLSKMRRREVKLNVVVKRRADTVIDFPGSV